MNARVRKRMFTTPVTIHEVTPPNSVGDVELLDRFNLLGYTFDEVIQVNNPLGVAEISTHQVFLPLDDIDKIDIKMKVTCEDSVAARIIQRSAYKGPRSKTLVGVLYLP